MQQKTKESEARYDDFERTLKQFAEDSERKMEKLLSRLHLLFISVPGPQYVVDGLVKHKF